MAAADESEKKSTIREYYEALLIAIVFVNFARIFAFQAFKIPSGSMEDNLKIGDHIIVNKFIYGPQAPVLRGVLPLRDVRRGDVIVFRSPERPEIDFVKRVIALPGETVTIRDKKVFVDGRQLDEPYTVFDDPRVYPAGPFLPEPYRSRDQFGPLTVPAGEYFAMGDNRDHSHDSRYWGTVPRGMIKGRAFMVYWSFDMQPPQGGTMRERMSELGSVLRHFGTKTRWDRSFFVVDSKYHYTPGISAYGNE
ncbi:MAG TPA: signal peptidase I [Thermoanaerobaculia bacterium]|jgi:signal peptidase I|nr:signal peptidase I [Thermoanaerobaculia bacterium]